MLFEVVSEFHGVSYDGALFPNIFSPEGVEEPRLVTEVVEDGIRSELGPSWMMSTENPDVRIVLGVVGDPFDPPRPRIVPDAPGPPRPAGSADGSLKIHLTHRWVADELTQDSAEVSLVVFPSIEGMESKLSLTSQHDALPELYRELREYKEWYVTRADRVINAFNSLVRRGFGSEEFKSAGAVLEREIANRLFDDIPNGREMNAAIDKLEKLIGLGTNSDDVFSRVEVLDPARTAAVRRALEAPTGLVEKFIASASSKDLDEFVENDIRNTLQQLALEYQQTEPRPDRITDYVTSIAAELAKLQVFGVRAREMLLALGAEPPEVIDEIVSELQAALDLTIGALGNRRVDDGPDVIDVIATPIPAALESVDEKIEAAVKPSAMERFGDAAVKGAGGATGKAAVDGVKWLSAVFAVRYGLDPTVLLLSLLDSLRRIVDIFGTNWTPPDDGD